MARGFTLLEVLIAFAIAGLALTGLFRSSSAGLENTAVAARAIEAVGLAQSLLAAELRSGGARAGAARGEDANGFAWRTTVSPAASQPGLGLYRIDVEVVWTNARARSVQLSGFRVVAERRDHRD